MMKLILILWVGGLSWHDSSAQYREVPLPFPDSLRFRVQFIEDRSGWVSSMNGTILHTSDGGLHWDLFATPYPKQLITEIRFFSSNYGILWASPDRDSYSGRLYQTSNAGKDWQRVPLPDSIFIYTPDLGQHPLGRYDVYPLKEGHILFNGQRVWRLGTSAQHSEEIAAWTTDGGDHWNKVTGRGKSVLMPVDSVRWGFFDPAYDLHDPDFPPHCSFALSTDRGLKWRGTRSWDAVLGTNCEFWDSKRGIVYGNVWYANYQGHWDRSSDSGSYLTYDGGETWEKWWRVCDIFSAVLTKDSTMYCVEGGSGKSWEKRQYGPLLRCQRRNSEPEKKVFLSESVTALSAVGSTVYALLLDGRLIVIDEALVGIRETGTASNNVDFTLSPNPARENITVSRTGPGGTTASLEIFNSAGTRVRTKSRLTFEARESQLNISLSGLAAGTYFLVSIGAPVHIHGFTLLR